MPKIEASKLNRSLKQVLEGVAEGKRYELTRYGKVVAKIVPPNAKEPKAPDIDVPAEPRTRPVVEPTTDQIRQHRRDALLRMVNRAK